jgi:hypothetical protein
VGPILPIEERMGLLFLNGNKLRRQKIHDKLFLLLHRTQHKFIGLDSPVKVCTKCSLLAHISPVEKTSKLNCYSATTTFNVSGCRG